LGGKKKKKKKVADPARLNQNKGEIWEKKPVYYAIGEETPFRKKGRK